MAATKRSTAKKAAPARRTARKPKRATRRTKVSARKITRRKLTRRRLALERRLKAIAWPPAHRCTDREICRYLKRLSQWLVRDFLPDYERLRLAVCNVEDQAFNGTGVPADRFPACGGGTGGGPAPVAPPPLWT